MSMVRQHVLMQSFQFEDSAIGGLFDLDGIEIIDVRRIKPNLSVFLDSLNTGVLLHHC